MSSQPRPDGTARLMLFFAIVYAVEGIGQAKSGIVWQPLTHFLKETRGWGPVEVSVSLAVLDVPWVIKPLSTALVSDFLPLLAGYRRRPYLLLASIAAAVAFAWVGTLTNPADIVPALVVTSVAMAAASTVCGALLVENGQRLNASDAFVNQQWLWFNVAIVVASLLGGFLIEVLSTRDALRAALLAVIQAFACNACVDSTSPRKPPRSDAFVNQQWFNVAAVVASLSGGFLIEVLSSRNALRAAAWIAAMAPLAVIASLLLVHEERATIDRGGFRSRGWRRLLAAFRSRDLWLIGAFLFLYSFQPRLRDFAALFFS